MLLHEIRRSASKSAPRDERSASSQSLGGTAAAASGLAGPVRHCEHYDVDNGYKGAPSMPVLAPPLALLIMETSTFVTVWQHIPARVSAFFGLAIDRINHARWASDIGASGDPEVIVTTAIENVGAQIGTGVQPTRASRNPTAAFRICAAQVLLQLLSHPQIVDDSNLPFTLIRRVPARGVFCTFTAHASAVPLDINQTLHVLTSSATAAQAVVNRALILLRTNTPKEVYDITNPSSAGPSTDKHRSLVGTLLGILHEGITGPKLGIADVDTRFLPASGPPLRALMFNLLDLKFALDSLVQYSLPALQLRRRSTIEVATILAIFSICGAFNPFIRPRILEFVRQTHGEQLGIAIRSTAGHKRPGVTAAEGPAPKREAGRPDRMTVF